MSVPARPVPDTVAEGAHVDAAGYERMYRRSVEDPDAFWGEHGRRLDWITPYTTVKNTTFEYPDVSIRWFEDGTLNVSANCIDRHLEKRADQVAIVWEGDDPSVDRKITYAELHEEVCRLANVYKDLGVTKGDRIVLYMPMVPEAAFAMLASARIGAIHSIVFGGFSPDALGDRINGSEAKLVVTADEGYRGGRTVPLKANADRALDKVSHDVQMLVVRRTGGDVSMRDGQDHWYDERVPAASADCEPEPMNAEDPLFILYTSGSTGMPKGVVHTTGGYLVYAAMTHEYTFDYHDGDVFWCTADVGWVTGHSYIVYGPLANGATTLMFEGVPTYPSPARFWQVCEKHSVNQFYTAPTAIRALMGAGESHVEGSDLSALKVLGTVGEPINPEAWNWYDRVVGKGKLPIVDTWWQTETGGHLITPAARRDPDQAGFGHQALLRRRARGARQRGERDHRDRGRRGAGDQGQLAGPDEDRLSGPRALRVDLLRDVQGLLLHGRRLPARRGRLLVDHGPGGRRHQRVGSPDGHRRGGVRARRARQGVGGGGRRLPARRQGPGDLRLRDADGRQRAVRGAQEGARGVGAKGDRPDREPGQDPVRAGDAQDALREDHAPDPEKDRRERLRVAGRHLHARRPRGRRRPDRAPREPRLTRCFTIGGARAPTPPPPPLRPSRPTVARAIGAGERFPSPGRDGRTCLSPEDPDKTMSTQDHSAYWAANKRLMVGCLIVWALVSFGFGILLRPLLSGISVGGTDLGFWFAQQGSILTFIVLIFFYAFRMNALDKKFGVQE